MRKQLLGIIAIGAACLAVGAQAQTSTDPSSSSSSSGSKGSGSSPSQGYSGSQSGWTAGHMGRMGQELKASQLTGAQIGSSSGSEIGTISDLVVNSGSGRIDFAVISLSASSSSTGAATSPSGTSSSTGTSSASTGTSGSSALGASSSVGGTSAGATTSTAGKQVAVPWMLLRPSATSTSGTSATSTTGQQPGFVFTGDSSKLDSAPSFDATTDLSQPSWRHSVFSYFGLSAGAGATGGAETPGGSSGSSSIPETSPSPK